MFTERFYLPSLKIATRDQRGLLKFGVNGEVMREDHDLPRVRLGNKTIHDVFANAMV